MRERKNLNNQFNNSENNVKFATNPLAYNNYQSPTSFVKNVNPLTEVEFNKKDIKTGTKKCVFDNLICY